MFALKKLHNFFKHAFVEFFKFTSVNCLGVIGIYDGKLTKDLSVPGTEAWHVICFNTTMKKREANWFKIRLGFYLIGGCLLVQALNPVYLGIMVALIMILLQIGSHSWIFCPAGCLSYDKLIIYNGEKYAEIQRMYSKTDHPDYLTTTNRIKINFIKTTEEILQKGKTWKCTYFNEYFDKALREAGEDSWHYYFKSPLPEEEMKWK